MMITRTSTGMLWTEAVFMSFILFSSGAWGQKNSICALKGSSVNLSCSAPPHIQPMKWFIIKTQGTTKSMEKLSESNETYNMGEENNFDLMIKDVRYTNSYCCKETPDNTNVCWQHRTELHVTDLQVKVFPSTEGQTVTMMCSTSCPLTEKPAAYIWYKNREFLYEDWSPWYQDLVSSEGSVTYSCAIKGYKDLRAPEVSVDSITSACFTVTFAEGTMCSSEKEPCSITYPREVRIHWSNIKNYITLTCNTSCPGIDPNTAYSWYWNRKLFSNCDSQDITLSGVTDNVVSCAVKGNDYLHSDETCAGKKQCLTLKHIRRRICALEGSSVEITSIYSNEPLSKLWYKISSGEEIMAESPGRVEFLGNDIGSHTLRINELTKNDSAEYMFATERLEDCDCYFPGAMLVVTDLRVTMTPSSVVTEGQTVSLTCSTSCPLNKNTIYIWYFNNQPLTLPEKRTKYLVLAPVSTQHAGNYSCALQSPHNMSSSEKALTVKVSPTQDTSIAVMNGLKMTASFFIPLVGFVFYLKIRKKKVVTDTTELSDNVEPRHIVLMNEDLAPMVMSEQAEQQEDTV